MLYELGNLDQKQNALVNAMVSMANRIKSDGVEHNVAAINELHDIYFFLQKEKDKEEKRLNGTKE